MRFVSQPNSDDQYVRAADVNLGAKLDKEASGILAWLVRGCLNWQKNASVLYIPDCIRLLTEAFRSEGDDLSRFIAANLKIDQEAKAFASEVYKKYQYWCMLEGIDYPLGPKQFGVFMSTKFQKKNLAAGNVYLGIFLNE